MQRVTGRQRGMISPDVTHGIPQVLTEVRWRKQLKPCLQSRHYGVGLRQWLEIVAQNLQPAMTICLTSHGTESTRGKLNMDFMQWSKLWIKIFFKGDLDLIRLFHLYLIKWTKWPFVWLPKLPQYTSWTEYKTDRYSVLLQINCQIFVSVCKKFFLSSKLFYIC